MKILRSIQNDPNIEDIEDAMKILGFSPDISLSHKFNMCLDISPYKELNMSITWANGVAYINAAIDGISIPNYKLPKSSSNVAKIIYSTERFLHKYGLDIAENISFSIQAGMSTRDLLRNLVKVKSSNIWGYTINVKNRKDKFGDVLVQFKGDNGGPGDVYIYYDVPVLIYRRWQSAPSKGHYFWQYIRNYFKYSKLTGDKRGKLSNAIN